MFACEGYQGRHQCGNTVVHHGGAQLQDLAGYDAADSPPAPLVSKAPQKFQETIVSPHILLPPSTPRPIPRTEPVPGSLERATFPPPLRKYPPPETSQNASRSLHSRPNKPNVSLWAPQRPPNTLPALGGSVCTAPAQHAQGVRSACSRVKSEQRKKFQRFCHDSSASMNECIPKHAQEPHIGPTIVSTHCLVFQMALLPPCGLAVACPRTHAAQSRTSATAGAKPLLTDQPHYGT